MATNRMDTVSETTDLDFMRRVRDRFTESEQAWEENRKLALDDVKHRDGSGQWPEDIRKEREADGRPCLTINRLPGFVDQVIGDARQNRPRIRVRPVDSQSDPDIAKLIEGYIRNVEYVSHAEHAYDTALEHAVGHGFGYFRILKDYIGEDTFDQDLKISRIKNAFCVYPDPAAQEADLSDMNYCFITEEISKAEFKRRYPDATIPSDFELASTTGNQYSGWWYTDKVRIAEYWERVLVKRVIVQLRDGTVMREESVTGEMIGAVLRSREVQTWDVAQYEISGNEILKGPTRWEGTYIPVVAVLGKELVLDGKTIYRGIIRHAKDSQRMYNFFRSMATETVALQPRAPYIATVNQVAGYEDIWRNANRKSYSYLPYNNTGDPMPQRQFPASLPQGAFSEAQVAVDDMKATTGIYDASLGNRSNETSGKAIIARQKEGDKGTFTFHDNLSRAIQHAGRILVEMTPYVCDTERIWRIMNEDGTSKLVEINKAGMANGMPYILNDITIGKFDVVVEAGPSFQTQRQEAAESIVQFMQAIPQQAPLMADIAAKNMDWPEADKIAERLRKTLPPGIAEPVEGEPPQQQGPPPEEMMAQQAREMEGERMKLEYAKLDIERMKLELEKYKIDADLKKEKMKFAGATTGGTY